MKGILRTATGRRSCRRKWRKTPFAMPAFWRNWEGFGMGDHYSDIYSRPSSGEPWETIAAELAPKIDAKIKELYEA